MIERIRYGGVSNPYNYSEFTCDTAADIADLPTNKDIGKYKNLDTCSIGSKATVISDRTMYILNGNNQWVLLKDYKATGGGSSILIDETLTESGQAADAKAVGDKIAEVKESAHTHSNKDVLDEITSNKITAWDSYSAEIEKINSMLVRKTIQFRHGKGTFTTTATGTNVVWQYGWQKAQGSNCTFDVKSDNGLIMLECDTIESLTISSDTKNKMDLSYLGGKITKMLNLSNCPNITGDLSDLGGKITDTLSLSNCANITGVYSGTKYPKTFSVQKTAITSADMDANLINFAASGVKSGRFIANGMKRTAASDDAVATLVANGWTVSGLTKEG